MIKVKEIPEVLKCTICKRYLQSSEFHSNKARLDHYGLEWYCRECNVERARNWRNANRERMNEIGNKSYYKHRDRALARANAQYRYPDAQVCSTDGCFELGHRHHDDYSKPFEILWLCRKHHCQLEAKLVMV